MYVFKAYQRVEESSRPSVCVLFVRNMYNNVANEETLLNETLKGNLVIHCKIYVLCLQMTAMYAI